MKLYFEFNSIKSTSIALICLIILHMSDYCQANSFKCATLFTDFTSSKHEVFSTNTDRLSSFTKEYYSSWQELFPDLDISILNQARTTIIEQHRVGAYGFVDPLTHAINLSSNISKSPLFPIYHAHELQHFYDLEVGLIQSMDSPPAKEILDSEIRAVYRQLMVARSLYTQKDLETLKNQETDLRIKQGVQDLIDIGFGDTPLLYIGQYIYLNYHDLLKLASETENTDQQITYIGERMKNVLPKNNK